MTINHSTFSLFLVKSLIVNKKWIPYLIIIILAIILFFVKRYQWDNTTGPEKNVTTTNPKNPSSGVNRNRGFDRRVSYIEYTEHAKCRMQCRKISESEVKQIMQDGKINYNKSDVQNSRCPRYAVEGITTDDQKVRIVFAQCNDKTTVVTVIDLETEWTCHCPGDDKKYGNKN